MLISEPKLSLLPRPVIYSEHLVHVYKGVLGMVLRLSQNIPGYSLCKHTTEVFGRVRYGLNTLPKTLKWFGVDLIPVPNTSVNSVRPPKMRRVLIYAIEHTLAYIPGRTTVVYSYLAPAAEHAVFQFLFLRFPIK